MIKNERYGASEMAQQVRAHDPKPKDLSSSPHTHKVDNSFLNVIFSPPHRTP